MTTKNRTELKTMMGWGGTVAITWCKRWEMFPRCGLHTAIQRIAHGSLPHHKYLPCRCRSYIFLVSSFPRIFHAWSISMNFCVRSSMVPAGTSVLCLSGWYCQSKIRAVKRVEWGRFEKQTNKTKPTNHQPELQFRRYEKMETKVPRQWESSAGHRRQLPG